MRTRPALAVALVLALAACGTGSSGGPPPSGSASPTAGCPPEPCDVGAVCFTQAEPACNGAWYCWSDRTWRCAPQDSGPPGGPPAAAAVEDGGADAPAD